MRFRVCARCGGMLKTKAATSSTRFHSPFCHTLRYLCNTSRLLHAACLLVLFGVVGLSAGCERFQREQHDSVYVAARKVYLHDRVAAVSERVALVNNGQKLEVLEHNRRFFKVKTEKGETGWVEERAVIDSKTYQEFAKLAEEHKQDPRASTATLRDDLYMHIAPGRQSEHFYLLPGDAKVELLARASKPRVTSSGAVQSPSPRASKSADARQGKSKTAAPGAKEADVPPPPVMEDWWLARDQQGRVGWLLASRLDVDVPDEIAQYGENQRFIGSWLLTKVNDPGADKPADHQVPEYLVVTAPYKSGMPFDFDQVRVFTWSTRRHRYETAFRLRPIQGFLPVHVTTMETPRGPVPAFSFQIAGSQNVSTDPDTGVTRPVNPRTINYQMIDTQVKRVGPDMAPIPIMRGTDRKAMSAQRSARKQRR